MRQPLDHFDLDLLRAIAAMIGEDNSGYMQDVTPEFWEQLLTKYPIERDLPEGNYVLEKFCISTNSNTSVFPYWLIEAIDRHDTTTSRAF